MADARIWTSRKFMSAWILTFLFTFLLWYGKLTPDAFSTSASFIWIGYFAGNVGEKYVEAKGAKS